MKPFERPFSFTKKKDFLIISDNKAKLLFLPSLPNLPIWIQPKEYKNDIDICVEFPLENTDSL